tara:strand:- start:1751 stop:1972 length:222 start_codon:yes stop_codon:yes gene_type:complete
MAEETQHIDTINLRANKKVRPVRARHGGGQQPEKDDEVWGSSGLYEAWQEGDEKVLPARRQGKARARRSKRWR